MTKIHSMASNDCVFPVYKAKQKGETSGENRIEKAVIIKGKANVRDPKTLQTPKHSVTEVTPEELKILQASPAFNRKLKAGFYSIDKVNGELKADKSAQMTENDPRVKQSKAKTKTNSEGED
jgi:hypothetical protein